MAMTEPPVELHYQFDGRPDGPVLVLSHSLGLSLQMWESNLPRLSARFRILRYDHRGHGSSPAPPAPYAIADFGRDLVRLLDRLELERVSFCGLSLGGMVGQWLGVNAPQRVDRLVLCCTAPVMARPADYAARASMVRAQGMASIADTVIGRWFTPGFMARRPDAVAKIRAALLATPAEGYAATCEALVAMDLREDLPRIAARTLVIAGAADQATPPDQSRAMAARMPDAEVLVIPEMPHLGSVEQPDAVTDQILRWVPSPTS
jgi:3-oxoadipate enol-lactonase